MTLFLSLVEKVLPLYFMTGVGYLAGRFFQVDRESLANLSLFVLLPGVMFLGVYRAEWNASLIAVPIIFFFVCALLCIVGYRIGKRIWHDGSERIFAFSVGSGNTGYFGIPMSLAILGPEALTLAVLADFGESIAVHSVGYYHIAKAHLTTREAIIRVLKFPTLYALALGLLVNVSGLEMPSFMIATLDLMKNCYAPLGMMIIGLGLSTIQAHHIHPKFITLSVVGKYLGWFALVGGFVYLDQLYFHILSDFARQLVIVQAATPIAASTVAYASRFKLHPEKAALTVLISTLVSLAIVPLIAVWMAG